VARQTNRSDAIFSSIRRAILEQALKPGTKLPEDQIGEVYGVSRTGVRNALVRLASEGLVELRPNRGAAVAVPTLDEVRDAFDIRRFLEREVVRRLCERMGKDGIDALEAHIREEERALRTSAPRGIRLAGEFHILLAELTGSPSLADYVSRSVSRCSLILSSHARPHSAQCGIDEHKAIVAALAEQDAAACTSVMDAHLVAVRDRALAEDPSAEPDIAAILGPYAEE
jgi:DNA-binding GntR family transcriptional regulator